jgi:hypothetical protein
LTLGFNSWLVSHQVQGFWFRPTPRSQVSQLRASDWAMHDRSAATKVAKQRLLRTAALSAALWEQNWAVSCSWWSGENGAAPLFICIIVPYCGPFVKRKSGPGAAGGGQGTGEENGHHESASELAKRFGVTRRTAFRYKAIVRKVRSAFELRGRAPENGNAKGKHKKQSKRNTNQH